MKTSYLFSFIFSLKKKHKIKKKRQAIFFLLSFSNTFRKRTKKFNNIIFIMTIKATTQILTILFVSLILQYVESKCYKVETTVPIVTTPDGGALQVGQVIVRKRSTTTTTTVMTTTVFNCARPPGGLCDQGWIQGHYVTCSFTYDDMGCFAGCSCITTNFNGLAPPESKFKNTDPPATEYYYY